MALSVMVALILTPALCATLLKAPADEELKHHGGFFGWFNRNFERMNHGYSRSVEHVTRAHRPLPPGVPGDRRPAWARCSSRIPKSFLPDEDQGVLFSQVTSAAGHSGGDHRRVLDQVRDHFLDGERCAVGASRSTASASAAAGKAPGWRSSV